MRRCFGLICILAIAGALPQEGMGSREVALEFEGETLSARLDGAPLGAVIEKISAEKSIRFLGGESLLSMEVTARFSRVPFEEGLKRILEGTSYVFGYDQDGNISEVSLVRSSTGTRSGIQQPLGEAKRVGSGVAGRRTHDPVAEKVSEPVKTMQSGGAQVLQGAVESGGDQIPGGLVEALTAEEMENFKVEENVPPPGGPVGKVDPASLGLKIVPNAPPPGGDIKDAGAPGIPR